MNLLALLLVAYSLAPTIATAIASSEESNGPDAIYCSTGFLSNPTKSLIQDERLNDGYCDCPLDGGIDELETGACSGSSSGGWPGLKKSDPLDDNIIQKRFLFTCPQQPDLQLYPSRINDGICDCCDGADENNNSKSNGNPCQDICDVVLAKVRAERKQLEQKFIIGSKIRNENIDSYRELYERNIKRRNDIQNIEIPKLESSLQEKESNLKNIHLVIMNQYFDSIKNGILLFDSRRGNNMNPPNGSSNPKFLLPLGTSIGELKSFITSACHLVGEISDADNSITKWKNQHTCIPLRLAGMDLGILWENEQHSNSLPSNLSSTTPTNITARIGGWNEENLGMEILSILIQNTNKNAENLSIGKDDVMTKNIAPQENNYDEYDMDDNVLFDDDEILDYEEDVVEEDIIEEEQQVDVIRIVNEPGLHLLSPISVFRLPFYNYANKVIANIDSMLKESETEDNDDNDDDEEVGSPQFDPMAIQMTRNTLSRRVGHINRGLEFASSANLLLTSLSEKDEFRDDNENVFVELLQQLAIRMIHHSRLSAADIAEIIILNYIDVPENTCISLYNIMCSPNDSEFISTDGNKVIFPGDILRPYVVDRCKERYIKNKSCEDDGREADIPLFIRDGLFNFYAPKPHNNNDFSNYLRAPYNILMALQQSKVPEQEKMIDNIKTEISSLHTEIQNIGDMTEGKDDKYGIDAELYHLQDKCFDIESGKYRYEVCIFGQSKQYEGQSKGGGTSLGNWSGISVDENTGSRTMKWKNGTKCWNGPHRSATVIIDCGAETRLLSADEPSTCEYLFKMESPIGCDENWKITNNIY